MTKEAPEGTVVFFSRKGWKMEHKMWFRWRCFKRKNTNFFGRIKCWPKLDKPTNFKWSKHQMAGKFLRKKPQPICRWCSAACSPWRKKNWWNHEGPGWDFLMATSTKTTIGTIFKMCRFKCPCKNTLLRHGVILPRVLVLNNYYPLQLTSRTQLWRELEIVIKII